MNNKNYTYQNTLSYIKVLKRFLPKEIVIDENKEYAIEEMYNSIISDFSDEKMFRIQTAAGLLESKLLAKKEIERLEIVKQQYETFLRSMLCNFYIGRMEDAKAIFDKWDETVEIMSGFFGIFGENYEDNLTFSLRK